MRDLSADDLTLYDDNVPQRIQLEDVTLPVSLAIAVQTTSASAIVLDRLRKATGVIGPMITGYHGEAEVTRAIKHLEARSAGAGIADAVTLSLQLLAERKEHRRVLLVLFAQRDALDEQGPGVLRSSAERPYSSRQVQKMYVREMRQPVRP